MSYLRALVALVALVALRRRRYLGHSPAGGAMVVALQIGLLATVGTGLVFYALRDHAGPLAAVVAPAEPASSLRVGNDGDDRCARGPASAWGEIHEVLAHMMLVLVIIHVAGVLLASYLHRENLVKAMITGDKGAQAAGAGGAAPYP